MGCKVHTSFSLWSRLNVSPCPSPTGTKQRGQKCADSAVSVLRSQVLVLPAESKWWPPFCDGHSLCVLVLVLYGDSLNHTISPFSVCFKFPLTCGFSPGFLRYLVLDPAITRILDPVHHRQHRRVPLGIFSVFHFMFM